MRRRPGSGRGVHHSAPAGRGAGWTWSGGGPASEAEAEGIVDSHGASAAQVALAWVLSRGDGVVPLAKSSRPAHVENSAAAVDLVLTEADLARIDEVVPAEGAHGARYPVPAMRLIDAG